MLTLVTATLNAARFLDRALKSAATQGAPLQHLVIDGGSTDGTIEICRRHPTVETVVAPGSSIYDAWNIGLDRARGDAVMFLNADDELAPGAIAEVERVLGADSEAEIVAGRARFYEANDGSPPHILVAAPRGALEVHEIALGVPAINAMAFRRALFNRHGRFETIYRVAGDRAFLLRLALLPAPPIVVCTEAVLYHYYAHPGSLTLQRSLEQRLRIARDHIALSRALLAGDVQGSAALWLRHLRRREAVVAGLRCLAAGRPAAAWDFAVALFS